MNPNPYLVAFVGIAFGMSVATPGNGGMTFVLMIALGILTGFFQSFANAMKTDDKPKQ